MVQWLRIHLATQWTQVQSQSGKTHVPQLLSPHSRAHTPQEKPMRHNGGAPHSLQLEKVHAQQQGPSTVINK